MALTAKIRTSQATPSIIFLGSKVVSLQSSKFSLIHLELCFFFLSIKYPTDGIKQKRKFSPHGLQNYTWSDIRSSSVFQYSLQSLLFETTFFHQLFEMKDNTSTNSRGERKKSQGQKKNQNCTKKKREKQMIGRSCQFIKLVQLSNRFSSESKQYEGDMASFLNKQKRVKGKAHSLII